MVRPTPMPEATSQTRTVPSDPAAASSCESELKAMLRTNGSVTAGRLAITSGATLSVVNPPPGPTSFNSPETIGLTQEQLAFSLADDPRGYGNPDTGWHRVTDTNHVLAGPLPESPPGTAVFAVRYGPHPGVPFTAKVRAMPAGLVVEAPEFCALVGDPAGDTGGEPVLRLTARP